MGCALSESLRTDMTLRLLVLFALVVAVIVGVGACAFSQRSVGTVALVPGATFRFPTVQGNHLEGRPFALPKDFSANETSSRSRTSATNSPSSRRGCPPSRG
jgi:hypothetical protein